MARIEPIPLAEWPPEMIEAMAALRPPHPTHPLPRRDSDRPRALNALGTLARHPALTQAFNTFNGHVLFATTLSARQRELIVLRVASIRHADYEWAQHVVLARDAGLTAQEISRVIVGPTASGWSALDRALLAAVDELVGDAMVSDETWAVLADEFDERQVMDVVFTVGAYDAIAMAFRSFGIELDDDLRQAIR